MTNSHYCLSTTRFAPIKKAEDHQLATTGSTYGTAMANYLMNKKLFLARTLFLNHQNVDSSLHLFNFSISISFLAGRHACPTSLTNRSYR